MKEPMKPPLADRIAALNDVSLADETSAEHDADAAMLSAIETALLGGETHYTVRPGIPELRRLISQEIVRAGGPFPDAADPTDNVLITSDVAETLFVIVLGLRLESGGAVCLTREACRHERLFRLMGLRIEPEPSSDTRLIYRSWDVGEKQQAEGVAWVEGKDVPDVLDLGPTLFDRPWASFPPVEPSRTLITGNLDTLPGMVSFRVAYLVGPKDQLTRIRTWKRALSICSAAPSQRAAIHAISHLRREES
jgi:aspartate/methionine/tyrosine aminotransferase